jgi:hypothetical protein
MKWDDGLNKIFEIQENIKDIHPFIEKLFPVTVAENNKIFIFEPELKEKKYVFVKEANAPLEIPRGARSAFLLECYKNKVSCVITSEAFDNPFGYVAIFHEFMHCMQYELCEIRIKNNLKIFQKAILEKNFNWELDYPFPYNNLEFENAYSSFLKSVYDKNFEDISKNRKLLRKILNYEDFEYMVIQEWKEGFARFIENKISERLGFKENRYGSVKPFTRISFYVGGEGYIKFLTAIEPDLAVEIEKLFYKMMSQQ